MTNGTDDRIRLARMLVDAGLGGPVMAMLSGILGHEANQLRKQSRRLEPKPGIYALLISNTQGVPDFAYPLGVRSLVSSAARRKVSESLANAFEAARTLMGNPVVPALTCALDPTLLDVNGPSLGLAAGLALIARMTDKKPERAVFATGHLGRDGRVSRVDYVERKIQAARTAAREALILVPPDVELEGATRVATLEEASAHVFGQARPRVAPEFVDVESVLERCGGPQRDDEAYVAAATELLTLAATVRAPADQAQLLYAASTQLRHAGRAEEARALGTEALALLRTAARAVPGDVVEFAEIDSIVSDLDADFDLEAVEARLRNILPSVHSIHNQLRCRGTLAMTLAMKGQAGAAVEMRLSTLELHQQSQAIARERPRTLSALVLEAAMKGDRGLYEDMARGAAGATSPDDHGQREFNASNLIRGHVLLRDYEAALAFAKGEAMSLGHWAPTGVSGALTGDGPIGQYPLVSAMRAIVQAELAVGNVEGAAQLARRLERGAENAPELVAWLALCAQLIVARHQRDAAAVESVTGRIRKLNRGATAYFVDGDRLRWLWY